ncbi:MAG TPA: nuclear transport factor 2 family protein [Sphingomonadaceae bacterium]|nr:nuclear transport factor 2 family protein [Sphingomonadaceae bacterium]
MADALSADDEVAIRNIVSRYCWALDTGDVEGFVSCFASDGLLEWDAFEVPLVWQGSDALRHFATYLRDQPSTAGRQHHVTNVIIEPSAKGAIGKAYVAVALRQGDGPHLLNVMGWYEDEFRREEGEWKIASRIIRDWSGPVVGNISGQTGERVARPLPPPLAGLVYRASED